MTLMYAVTSGCYSDYQISGIFSTREKAEKWMRFCGCADDKDGYGSRIEEFPLDEGLDEFERGLLLFSVLIRKDGDVLQVRSGGHPSLVRPIKLWSSWGAGSRAVPPQQNVYVWARDESHAIKIANERRIEAIAAGVQTYGPPPHVEGSRDD